MRLIDADDVIETISHYLVEKMYALYPNDKMPDFDKGMIDGYARARSIVFETPTIDPVKHGRWYRPREFQTKSYKRICTNCQDVAYYCGSGDYRYCPNCGAKMTGEDNE